MACFGRSCAPPTRWVPGAVTILGCRDVVLICRSWRSVVCLEQTAMSTDMALSVDMPLGFGTTDDVVNQLALILRLLYVADLRALQTQANEIIASCQALARSALDDPRANVHLGRGRHGR